jgi:hypothetical protein
MKMYGSTRNDFQYFMRSMKGHLIFYDIYCISKEHLSTAILIS